jgi:hypothetical protein
LSSGLAHAKESGFDDHVFIDSASFVLVAESQSSLASMFGHSFLKLEGRNKKHALSYYNSINSNIISYINVLLGNSDGIYVLMPYDEMKESYIKKEKRSLWEFRLSLTESEKIRLKSLIKNLEGQTNKYNFFFNNCNSQIELLLSSVNKNFNYTPVKKISTPLEYAKYLTRAGLVEEITYIPSKKVYHIPKIHEYPYITRLSMGYYQNGTIFNFYPIYHDKNQLIHVEREVDSRILGINFLIDKNLNFEVLNFDIFKLTSYDLLTTSIDIGVDHGPRLMFGAGTSLYYKNFFFYSIPHIGYREQKTCISLKSGASIKILPLISASLEYEIGSDFNSLQSSITYKLLDDIDIQIKYILKKHARVTALIGVYF